MGVGPISGSVGVLVSGGLDSAILTGVLLKRGCRVHPLYVRCGLAWESCEYDALRRFLAAIEHPRLERVVAFDLPLGDLYGRHWSVSGQGVPDAESADEAVYLPGRNALLLVKPLVWCQLRGVERLALGVLGTNPFADARPDFFRHLAAALNGQRGGAVEIIRPFAELSKREVMELGRQWPLELTFSCIAPVDGVHCGQCNKCAERAGAFRLIGASDPTHYAAVSGRTVG
jgi:7-cyano-7-deazaguanine synthase